MSRTAGYTLIELVLVILIMNILVVYITLKSPVNQMDIAANAEQLALNLKYAQTLSMTSGARYCLLINGTTYQLINSSTGASVPFPGIGTSAALAQSLSFTLSPSLKMIVFDGLGAPYYSTQTTCTTSNAGSALALSTSANLTITDGTNTKSVLITPETGMVYTQ